MKEQIGAVIVIHVDHGDVRGPFGEDRIGLGQRGSGTDHEEAVVQRQLDEIDDDLPVVEDQRAARLRLVDRWQQSRHDISPVASENELHSTYQTDPSAMTNLTRSKRFRQHQPHDQGQADAAHGGKHERAIRGRERIEVGRRRAAA